MDKIRIVGGNSLNGRIPISGAKNASLPLMIASLLTKETLVLENVPRLLDVNLLIQTLSNHGVDFALQGKRLGEDTMTGQTVELTAKNIVDTVAPYELVSKMRAGFWVIGPLLARVGEAKVSLPGGCAIGNRPVDYFIDGLEVLGASVEIDSGYVVARANNGLKGGKITLPKASVGATHTLMMAACLAKGETVIENVACEPEVVEVANCLIEMGAKIEGAGTNCINIEGVQSLSGTHHRVIPDRIETGTYAMALAMVGGEVFLEGARADTLASVLNTLKQLELKFQRVKMVSTLSGMGVGLVQLMFQRILILVFRLIFKHSLWHLCQKRTDEVQLLKQYLKTDLCMFKNWCVSEQIFHLMGKLLRLKEYVD